MSLLSSRIIKAIDEMTTEEIIEIVEKFLDLAT